jgi:hypothetical protein
VPLDLRKEYEETSGVEKTLDTIRRIYAAAGASDHCRLVVGEGGHCSYAKLAWPVFRELAGWL